jgi:catechol 2,3-dioxygenase-like lactoylglutathione lyase family enzyme
MTTAKLRHIALTVPDIKREAEFFEKVFGFIKNSESDRAISLSDGVMNVTLLPYSADRYADKQQGTAVIGVDHIGFVIEDPKEYAAMDERIKANGGVFHAKATAGQALETKYADPHGIIFDISEPAHTWQGIKY